MELVERVRKLCGLGPDLKYAYFSVIDEPSISAGRVKVFRRAIIERIMFPCVMVSYGAINNIGDEYSLSQDLKLERSSYVYALDSGGYQIGVRGQDIDVKKYLDYVQKERPDIFFAIDVPPVLVRKNMNYSEAFKFALEKSSKYSEEIFRFVEKAELPESVNFYAVLHGGEPKTLEEWYEKCVSVFVETGLARGVAIGGLKNALSFSTGVTGLLPLYYLEFLREQGVRIAHVFGIFLPRGVFRMAKYFDLITSDTAPSRAPLAFLSLSVGRERLKLSKLRGLNIIYRLSCPCRACSGWEKRTGVSPLSRPPEAIDKDYSDVLLMHELFNRKYECLLSEIEYINGSDLTRNEEEFVEFLVSNGYRETWEKYARFFPDAIKYLIGRRRFL